VSATLSDSQWVTLPRCTSGFPCFTARHAELSIYETRAHLETIARNYERLLPLYEKTCGRVVRIAAGTVFALAGAGLAFCDQPRPLRRVYFLGDGRAPAPEIKPMSAAEVMMEWVKHSFLLDIEAKPRLADHFDR
jgi:hypothetical protein